MTEIKLTCTLKVDRHVPNLDLIAKMQELVKTVARQAWWAGLPITIRLEKLDAITHE
jgi:hypothetical protein